MISDIQSRQFATTNDNDIDNDNDERIFKECYDQTMSMNNQILVNNQEYSPGIVSTDQLTL